MNISRRANHCLVISDEIKIDVYVSLIKGKRQEKNGGKLTNEALSLKGHTPSSNIKTKANNNCNSNMNGSANIWYTWICCKNICKKY